MSDTRHHLLDAAEALVRTRGYTAFSYADLAKTVGVRKPTIHHHFPTKEDLGVALVGSYAEKFDAHLAEIAELTQSATERLSAYADLYLVGLRDERACLCAMLSSDHAAVPERIRSGVAAFFAANRRWLGHVVREGQKRGEIDPSLDPEIEAQALHASLVGAMFAARSLGSIELFETVADRSVERLRVGAR